MDVYYSYYRQSARYREGKLLSKKSTCDIPTMMKKAIDYFEQNKPEGAEIRGCVPWEFSEGREANACIKIEYAKRDGNGEMGYTESDTHPLTVNIRCSFGKIIDIYLYRY